MIGGTKLKTGDPWNGTMMAAEKIGLETVQYVSNILKYWLTYKLLQARDLIEEPLTPV